MSATDATSSTDLRYSARDTRPLARISSLNAGSVGAGYLGRVSKLGPVLAAVAAHAFAFASAAHADLKMCNSTASRIGVAIGYENDKGWATEGWWNIAAQSCETLLRGDVPSRFLYVYAVDYDRGGEWSGPTKMCVADKSFLIRDTKACEQNGNRTAGFSEVDTGSAKDWTIRLSPADDSARVR